MSELNFCKNCDASLKEEYKHCPECGQKVHDDLSIRVLFNNTISNYFSIDARFFSSFIPLMFRPGFLARKFVEGRRLQYLHPAQYYLFVSVVFFFILSFNVREYNAKADKVIKESIELGKNQDSLNVNPIDSTAVADLKNSVLDNPNIVTGINDEERKLIDSLLTKEVTVPIKSQSSLGYNIKALDSLIAIGGTEEEMFKVLKVSENANYLEKTFVRQLIKLYKLQGEGVIQAFFDTIPIALFFLLPVFAFILKIFYWRKGPFSYHLVFSFYYFSFLFIILGVLIGVNHFLWDIPGWLSGLAIFYTFIYLWLSMRYFYKQGYFLTFFKSGIVVFVNMLFILPATLLLIAAATFFLY